MECIILSNVSVNETPLPSRRHPASLSDFFLENPSGSRSTYSIDFVITAPLQLNAKEPENLQYTGFTYPIVRASSMDRENQQDLHLGQDAVLSSSGIESTTPGTEVNPNMVETTHRLEQSYTLPIQPNEGARAVSHSPDV